MFFMVYKKANNEIVQWRNDASTGYEISADDVISMYCNANNVNPADYGCYQQEEFNQSVAIHQHLITPETGEISNNPNYIPPVEE